MTYLIILYIFIILNTVNEVLVLVCGVCVCVCVCVCLHMVSHVSVMCTLCLECLLN